MDPSHAPWDVSHPDFTRAHARQLPRNLGAEGGLPVEEPGPQLGPYDSELGQSGFWRHLESTPEDLRAKHITENGIMFITVFWDQFPDQAAVLDMLFKAKFGQEVPTGCDSTKQWAEAHLTEVVESALRHSHECYRNGLHNTPEGPIAQERLERNLSEIIDGLAYRGVIAKDNAYP